MRRVVLIAALTAGITQALAHPAAVPHPHPHGLSVLPGLDAVPLAIVLVAFGTLAATMLRRK